MQISNIIVLAVALALPAANACKCYEINWRQEHFAHPVETVSCCGKTTGGVVQGDDCNAHSIRDHMDSFAGCCSTHSLFSDCKGGQPWRA
ncbi:hypothetical protein PT974_09458 [Cladobotryum mycophilum]|uniref:Uncharacterized protein n=1 Tax=Cladobotryum mycophilum TaxID=491253 RepID=A0ABR0SGC0_9HYPO